MTALRRTPTPRAMQMPALCHDAAAMNAAAIDLTETTEPAPRSARPGMHKRGREMSDQFYQPAHGDLVACDDGLHFILLDEANDHCNWVMRRHPDGGLVTVRKATEHELAHAKARQHIRAGVSQLEDRTGSHMIMVPRGLLQDLYAAAQAEADQRRAALGDFRPRVQAALDTIAADAKALLDEPAAHRAVEPGPIKMPARKRHYESREIGSQPYQNGSVDGWNAALDEVERLNK